MTFQQPLQQGPPEPVLKGEIKVFANVDTFQDVIDKNPDFPTWAPAEKNELADKFFQEKYADFTPEEHTEARTIFNKKYGVGQVGLDDNVADDPLSKTLIPVHRAVDLATLGIPARAWDAANFGGTNAGERRDNQLSQYATDPGMAGDFYRLSQNGIVQGIAGLGGALKSTGGMVVNAGKTGLASLATTVGNSRLARPFLGNAQKAAFTLGGSGYSALSNALAGLQGKQSAGEALASTALDIATLPLGGSRRITNALTQAGVGGASSIASDLIHGQPVNSKKAIEEALLQAGVGGAFPEAGKTKPTVTNRRNVKMTNPMQAVLNGQVMIRSAGNIEASTKRATNESLQVVERKQGITEKETSQKRLAAYKKEFDAYNSLATDPLAPMNQRVLARQNAKKIKELALKHQKAHEAVYGKTKKAQTAKKTLKPEQLPTIVKVGLKAHAKGGESKKAFRNAVKGYDPESQTKINRALESAIKKAKERSATEKQRGELEQEQRNKKKAEYQKKQRENKRKADEQAKQERENQRVEKKKAGEKAAKLAEEEAAVKKRLKAIEEAKGRAAQKEVKDADAKRKAELKALKDDILARNGDQQAKERVAKREAEKESKRKLDAEEAVLKKQAGEIEAEKKKAEKLAKAPDILDAADIERKAQELQNHSQANEKGQLEAKLAYHRKAAKNDLTRYGMSKERGQAINDSHQRVLDAYAQKQAQAKKKPTVVEMKAGQEVNRKALSKLNEEGGQYNAGDQTAKQKPASTYTLEDIKRTQEWDRLDEDTRKKAELIDATARKDGKGIAEYDAERSGDTHQFKYKTVTPLGFDLIGTPENPKLVMRAVNENGHDHTYYISPSAPNKETGFSSYMHDFTPMDEFNGKGKRGLEGSAYHGQREVNAKEILNRPIDRTAGFTSETEAALTAAEYGKDVHQVRKSIKRNLKRAGNKEKSAVDDIIDESALVDDTDLENALHESGHKSVDQVYEDVNGRPCANG